MTSLSTARFTRQARTGGLATLEVQHPLFSAALALQGAHLYHFAPAGSDSWLWLSPDARFEPGRAIRGGIPICWPWFGDPARNPEPVRDQLHGDSLPAHGFARTRMWVLAELAETDQEVLITLVPDDKGDSGTAPEAQWRGSASVSLTFRFRGDSLSLELTTTNTGTQPLALTQALHTYLPTADIASTTLHGLQGTTYLDTLDGWQSKKQDGDVSFDGETDRIYQASPAISVHGPDQYFYLTARGSASTVVWNPGPDKARRLSDFPDNDWTAMLCVETANAAADFRTLAPGQNHTLAMTLSRPFPPDEAGVTSR